MAHLNLSPSYVLQTVAPYLSLPKTQSLPRTTVPRKHSGPREKMFKGVTFHLGTLQTLHPLVWRTQLGLCQGGPPL